MHVFDFLSFGSPNIDLNFKIILQPLILACRKSFASIGYVIDMFVSNFRIEGKVLRVPKIFSIEMTPMLTLFGLAWKTISVASIPKSDCPLESFTFSRR